MSANQLVVGLAGSEFATVSEMQLLSKLQQQSRDIQYAVLKAADFASAVEINDQLCRTIIKATPINSFRQKPYLWITYS